ncbi:hypothetical protein FN846DRAFT_74787 [Sphaerosporella brunnea]|uniref:Fungal N-terminal domain-containing protein n=1 Tax=Sphaerosporella brunnea TaxID=1250544 RepID=A0A5J5ETJ5_9PEZI|nr:hypothetical protein FN846DRAFT_74787 [Sphaerosporella brunnea]
MSFGYSVGDFVTVSQLAWKVYAQYRDAPKQFRDVASEVRSLHAVLKQTEAFLAGNAAAAAAAGGADGGGGDLRIILDGCREVFTEAQALLQKFESLGTGRKKARDRLKWTQSEIAELRSRIVSNVGLLTAFKAGLLGCGGVFFLSLLTTALQSLC